MVLCTGNFFSGWFFFLHISLHVKSLIHGILTVYYAFKNCIPFVSGKMCVHFAFIYWNRKQNRKFHEILCFYSNLIALNRTYNPLFMSLLRSTSMFPFWLQCILQIPWIVICLSHFCNNYNKNGICLELRVCRV